MQRQGFTFSPMQARPQRPIQSSRQHDMNTGEHEAVGCGLRAQKFSTHRTRETEPLLLAQVGEAKQREEQEQREAKPGERLTTLHSQLYHQTEKLKQWKINTEIQINDKERKITEASKTIDSLRKSILELQFLNESVSSKLQDEKALKEETSHKIATTRNMCSALKEHLVRLENGVLMGGSMLDTQKHDAKERIDQFQELALRFQELEIKVNSKGHDLEKAMQMNQTVFKNESEQLKNKIKEAEECCQKLSEQNSALRGEILVKDGLIEQKSKEIDREKMECSFYQQRTEERSAALKECENLLQAEKQRQEQMAKEYQTLESDFKVKLLNLENSLQERDDEIGSNMRDINSKEEELIELKSKEQYYIESIEAKDLEVEELLGKVEELEHNKKRLNSELADMSSKICTLQQKLSDVESSLQLCKYEEESANKLLESEKMANLQLTQEMNTLKELQEKLKQNEIECKTLEKRIKEVEGNKEDLQFQANFAMSQVEEITTQLQALNDNNKALKKEMEVTVKELKQSKEDHEQISIMLQGAEITLKETIDELSLTKKEKKELQSKYDKLFVEKNNKEGAIQEIIESRDKSSAAAENKVKTLQDKISTKAKQINKFQAEIKTLKTQLKGQEKTIKKLEKDLTSVDENQQKLEQEKAEMAVQIMEKEKLVTEEFEKLKEASDKKENEKVLLERQIADLKNIVEESDKKSAIASKDLETARHTYEAEITEMCSTLEKYKMENERLMNAKEKELDKKTKSIMESKTQLEGSLKEKELQLKSCSEEIAGKDRRIEELEEKLKSLDKASKLEMRAKDQHDIDVEMIDADEKSPIIKVPVKKVSGTNKSPAQKISSEGPHLRRSFSTPRMSTQSAIPQVIPQTPLTPQGILRFGEDRAGKSKRVVFHLTDSQEMSDDEDPLYKKKKLPPTTPSSKSTSKIISVKPTVRESPKIPTPTTPKASKKDHFKSEELSNKKAKLSKEGVHSGNNEEIDKFKMLFPGHTDAKSPKARKGDDATKKGLFKSKIKKVVPRAKKKTGNEKMDLSWFDADSAFGFGTEE